MAGDRPDPGRLVAELERLRDGPGAATFSVVLHLLAHVELPEAQAERVVRALLGHRATLARSLGRDPGLRVAVIDYLSNVEKLLTNPTIVESSHLERTERSAITDALTGLGNRRHFSACLGLEVRRSRRYGLHLSLLMLDLDAFKRLNDSHGHLFGDLVLQRLGRVLRGAVRDADVASRYGGEEFAVILPETDRLGALAVAERIRTRIEQGFAEQPVAGRRARLTLSGGIASYPDDATEAAGLIDRADQALYLAKRLGKNRVAVHHPERRAALRYPARPSSRVRVFLARGDGPHRVLPLNLSRLGALVELPADCRPRERLELTFCGEDPAGRAAEWTRRCSVVRVEGNPGAVLRVAVSFDEPLTDECLRQQVRRSRSARVAVGARA